MKKNQFKILIFLLMVLLLFFISTCKKKPELIKISGNTMGTTYHISVFSELNDKSLLKNEIDNLLIKVNMEMSTYIKDSEISKFNSSNSIDWYPISKGFAKVVKNSLDISEKSNGAFDISIGPLITLWGFGKKQGEQIPSIEQIEATTKYIGYEELEISISPPKIKKKVSKLKINLSAIAKGYGVDKVAELLNVKGIKNYLVEIGGEIRVRGTKNNNKWRIGIITPDTINDYNKVVVLSNVSLATSGDYFNYFEKNGKRYSHTINPYTKRPITHKLASVTVIHKSCMLADGYATAINVMGPRKGYEFAIKNNLAIYMIIRKDKGFIIKMTPSFKELLSNK